MRDWIVGLQKGASERGEGVAPSQWADLEAEAGFAAPEELRDLYEAMDGAVLPPDVELLRVRDGESVLRRTLQAGPELPRQSWVFGKAGDHGLLFSARKEEVDPSEDRPDWLDTVGDGGWVFGWRKADGSTRYYRTLEQLLSRLVPPAETEEVGDITYARALTAVQGALDLLGVDGEEATPEIGNGVNEVALAISDEPAPKKKAAPKKKPAPKAKKAPAPKKKAAKKPAPKKKPAKKPAPKKAAKKPAPKKAKKKASRR